MGQRSHSQIWIFLRAKCGGGIFLIFVWGRAKGHGSNVTLSNEWVTVRQRSFGNTVGLGSQSPLI